MLSLYTFNPLLGNSLWFKRKEKWKAKAASPQAFQPPLGEFSMILHNVYNIPLGELDKVFQPPLGEFSMILCFFWFWFEILFSGSFNPLLGNSLWFKISMVNKHVHNKSFNPLLGNSLWFIMFLMCMATCGIMSFNPLLGNSLWFWIWKSETHR